MIRSFLTSVVFILSLHAQASGETLGCSKLLKPFFINFGSKWGTELLPKEDPTWSDPDYIDSLIKYAAPAITFHDDDIQLFMEWQSLLTKLGGKGDVVALTSSGTAANNLIFEIADDYILRKSNYTNTTRAEIISLGYNYGGVFGRSKFLNESKVPNPVIHPNIPLTDKELENLREKEKASLHYITEAINDSRRNIGGIFLEPISTNGGEKITVYRTEFLLKLQDLARRHSVLIFADEVLSGGGRTGNFWGYQYAQGFTPDYVSFGKGLILKGVFAPAKSNSARLPFGDIRRLTALENPLALLQATQILKAIDEQNLIQNAKEVGDYFYQQLSSKIRRFYGRSEFRNVSAVGLMFASEIKPFSFKEARLGYIRRLLPPLNLTKEDVDYLLRRLE